MQNGGREEKSMFDKPLTVEEVEKRIEAFAEKAFNSESSEDYSKKRFQLLKDGIALCNKMEVQGFVTGGFSCAMALDMLFDKYFAKEQEDIQTAIALGMKPYDESILARDLKTEFYEFCMDVAKEMHLKSVDELTLDQIKKLSSYDERALASAPITKTDKGKYQFIDAKLKEYFAVKKMAVEEDELLSSKSTSASK